MVKIFVYLSYLVKMVMASRKRRRANEKVFGFLLLHERTHTEHEILLCELINSKSHLTYLHGFNSIILLQSLASYSEKSALEEIGYSVFDVNARIF